MLAEHDGVDVRQFRKRREWTERMLVKHGAKNSRKKAEFVDPTVMELAGVTGVRFLTNMSMGLTL